MRQTQLKHSFLYMPECPVPFLGWNLLTKLKARVTFAPGGMDIEVTQEQALQQVMLNQVGQVPPEIYEEIVLNVRSEIWADGKSVKVRTAIPVHVKLKDKIKIPNLYHHPLKEDAKCGVQLLLAIFLQFDFLSSINLLLISQFCLCKNQGHKNTTLYRIWGPSIT